MTAASKSTTAMTAVELAKVFAENKGFYGAPGGWIYNAEGQPLAHGWLGLAKRLEQLGWIKVGVGIDWTRANWEKSRLGPSESFKVTEEHTERMERGGCVRGWIYPASGGRPMWGWVLP